jgi:pimeloyl-ACP methyl ester carboxylesterase
VGTAIELELRAGPLRVAAQRWGDGGGPKVLALHGWLDNAATFVRLAPLLHGLDLVAVDLPGHGGSQHRPSGAAYHFVDWVADVLAIADDLGWDGFALLGHSMGAGIATLVASAFPDRVSRAVLLEGFGPLSGDPEGAPGRLADALRDEARTLSGKRRTFPDLDAAAEARRRRTDLDLDAARALAARATEAAPGGGVRYRHDPRLKARSRMRLDEAQVLGFLAAIRCPVLAVRARRGWPFPEEYLQPRLAALATTRDVEVDGGHHVHLTHPERVAPLIHDFLVG